MRARVFALAFIACLGLPYCLHAQFQEPTKEELQMTSDPKAPGAAAVYLYREEKTDDNLHYHSIYERIKVLTEKGKEAATIKIPYERGFTEVKGIQGRTIHPDGTVVKLTAKPEDLMDVKTRQLQLNKMVFTLPSVEVGSILEYRLDIRYDDKWISSPYWEIQQKYFVHKAHYYFEPSRYMDNLLYSVHLAPGTKINRDAMGRYTYDVEDVPPVADEDWMPPLNSIIYRIVFYYEDSHDGKQFWEEKGKEWAKNAEHFATPGKSIRDAAAGLVAPSDTEDQKARKLYDAVQKLENTDFTREKSAAERKQEKIKEIKKAEDVWAEHSGSSNDLALLYVALARAVGLDAWPMEVVNRDRAIFDASFLQVGQLDDYIVVATIGGKETYLDPGQKMCPFGLVHWKHSMAGGLRAGPKGATIAITPGNTYLENQQQRIADVELAPDGSITGSIRVVLTGQQAMRWRQIAVQNDNDEVKKQFNEWMRGLVPDGVQVDFDHFLALEDYNVNLMAMVKMSGSVGSATGKRVFLPGQFFESHAKQPFVSEAQREIPVDVHYPERFLDDVTYRLPEGYAVESAPQTATIPWLTSAELRVGSKADKNSVRIVRSMAYNFSFVEPKIYSGLHDFYQKVATSDQQPVVLTRSTMAAKSN